MSSPEGRKIFKEALDAGGMESYFPLAEQFITQSDPSFCSVSTLAMVMNALNFDLKRVWKGSWRWVSEEMLQCESQAVCGHSISKVQASGLSFAEFESLARCHGVRISAHPVCSSKLGDCAEHPIDRFRDEVRRLSSSSTASSFLVTNFSRKHLGQTGDGHYSPIGGYHAARDLALVLDVARFKYPPYWVSLPALWASMAATDAATSKSRGYFVVSGWEEPLTASSTPITNIEDISSNSSSSSGPRCPSVIKSWVDFHPHAPQPSCLHHSHAHTHCTTP